MTIAQFIQVANQYGISWAITIAVGIAYWLEVQDRKKNCVPSSLLQRQEERMDKIVDSQQNIRISVEAIANLVRVAVFGKGGSA